MIPKNVVTAVALLIFLAPEGSLSQNALKFPKESKETCDDPRYLAKIHLKQTGYAQSIQYGVLVPNLTNGLTTHFWLNLDNINRNATLLSYALGLHQLDTVVLKYVGTRPQSYKRPKNSIKEGRKYVGGDTMAPFWELTLNGTVVFRQIVTPLVEGEWSHITATWDAYTNTWALYQDGGLLAKGTSLQVVDHLVPGGGVIAVGADQMTLRNGMDQEALDQGVEGWITHFYMHDKPIKIKDYFQKVWPSRCSVDETVFNDVINWVQTPRKLVGGVTEVKATSSCGYF